MVTFLAVAVEGAEGAGLGLVVVVEAVVPETAGFRAGDLMADGLVAAEVGLMAGDLGVLAEAGMAFFVPMGVRGFAAGLVPVVVDVIFVGLTGDVAAGAFWLATGMGFLVPIGVCEEVLAGVVF